YVITPANISTGQALTLNVTSRVITGATSYTIELNDAFDFTGNSFVKTGAVTQSFTGLSYGTTYYTRVKTNLSANYGSITSFRTGNVYVTTPTNNAVNVNYNTNVTAT